MTVSVDAYRERFTAFYESLEQVYPDVFAEGGSHRIGSTFIVPGTPGLDAQSFYLRHVLDLVFDDTVLVGDLMVLARTAFKGEPPPEEVLDRLEAADIHQSLYAATEAASSLTGGVGCWSEGTDLFANILANTDLSLQMVGIYDHTAERKVEGDAPAASDGKTLDQAAIDALFG